MLSRDDEDKLQESIQEQGGVPFVGLGHTEVSHLRRSLNSARESLRVVLTFFFFFILWKFVPDHWVESKMSMSVIASVVFLISMGLAHIAERAVRE